MATYAVELRDVSKTFPGGRNTAVFTAVDQINLTIKQGEFFTLLGPSGCGKTTTLRMIAGFEQPTSGEILINGQPMQGVAPNHRPVNTVFQNYALFPHLSVAQNVGFGLKVKRVPAAERIRRVQNALALVQLPTLDERRPGQLSGGQQQRVALARALVNEPAVLLLDEPLGALDLKLRKAMQIELKHLQAQVGITFIYVTHDQEEALTMSDRIAVMSQGVVQQIGTPRDIYDHPTNRFVADFIGETNFLEGSVVQVNEFATVAIGNMSVLGSANGRPVEMGQTVIVAIRPEKINLYPQGEYNVIEDEIGFEAEELAALVGGRIPLSKVDARQYLSAEKNNVVLEGRVVETIYIGTNTRYRVLLTKGAEIFVLTQNFGYRYDTTFNVGDTVYVHWAAENAHILTT